MAKLFVIMPFGRKRVPHAPEAELDFDRVYRELIWPAAESSGWRALRIDDSPQLGFINDHYLTELFTADLVIADISVPNGNVYYELGIRHAIASGGTILIALEETQIPFDLASHRVLQYAADPASWDNARDRIAAALRTYSQSPSANPVRAFLERLAVSTSPTQDPHTFERDLSAKLDRARTVDQLVALWFWVKHFSPVPASPLLALADRLAEYQEWVLAADVLRLALRFGPADFEIHRKLGWCLQFAGAEFQDESAAAFNEALRLNPSDPETLGMMGGRAKRLGDYAEAARCYAEGARISPNSLYMLVNAAAMTILQQPTAPQPGIDLYQKLLNRTESTQGGAPDEWTELVVGEAYFAVGDSDAARRHYSAAKGIVTTRKSLESAARQLDLFADVGFREDDGRALAAFLRRSETLVIASAEGPLIDRPTAALLAPAETPVVLVHLSDVHFGSVTKDGKSVSMHRFYDGENSQPLVRHLEDEFSRQTSHFQFAKESLHLVVSGDLTYTGSDQEYAEALAFLTGATSALGISRANVHLIPGNHDISWDLAKQGKRYRFDPYLECLARFYGEELFRLRYPRIPWPITLTNRPPAHDIIAVSYQPECQLLIVGLNSCVYETEQHHFGFVGERQLRNLRDMIVGLDVSPQAVRVALIHHHLHPFPELLTERAGQEIWVDVSTIRDAGYVEHSLERMGFDLVLHGHKHKPQLRETIVQEADPSKGQAARLIVAGAGSAGCVELEHNVPNHYEVIELRSRARLIGSEFLKIEWRILPLEPGAEWTTAKTWTLTG